MEFLGVGLGPVIVFFVLLLLFVGPEKLPETARTVGRYVRMVKKMSTELTDTVSRELALDEKATKTGSDSRVVPPAPTVAGEHQTGPDYVTVPERPKVLPWAPGNVDAGRSAKSGPGQPGS